MLPEGQILSIYKPKGMSSFAVVARIRKLTGERRVGHAGALDPLASGVLVVGMGRAATRELGAIVAAEKEYRVTIKLGETSATDDAEGAKTVVEVMAPPSREQVEQALKKFVGEIAQTPPAYSAVHVAGQRAYALARAGKPAKLSPRRVSIITIDLVEYHYPLLALRVVAAKGVYIRALARDIGSALGTGGYVLDLERTRVGKFRADDAVTLDKLAERLARP